MATQAPAASSSRRPAEPGQTDAVVGQFRIQMEIGKGSFATVYRAIHVVRDRSPISLFLLHFSPPVLAPNSWRGAY